MLTPTRTLLLDARQGGYALGAFNVYNLEGALAVVDTAEEMRSPVMLQILPGALSLGGTPLVALCLEMAARATVPVALHLDHCPSADTLFFALESGFSSVMADGSDLDYMENIRFTRAVVDRAHANDQAVEAELGKLSGEEDGLAVDEREARMTSPGQAADFIARTDVDALAVCIGNVHGRYYREPELDFDRLAEIGKRVELPLVLHGTSGLPAEMITRAMELGVCKFNVNTEVRSAYVNAMRAVFERSDKVELIDLMNKSIEEMKEPIRAKIELFCSSDRAHN